MQVGTKKRGNMMKNKWKFGDITVEEVKYGFGWQLSDNPSSSTIAEILDKLEKMFYNIEKGNKDE